MGQQLATISTRNASYKLVRQRRKVTFFLGQLVAKPGKVLHIGLCQHTRKEHLAQTTGDIVVQDSGNA
jgi:hypothetical protein